MTMLLKDRIKRHIEMSGPLPLAEYMHWCMADRDAGYYKNQNAIGRKGDFITAPEVSQMFGELIGIWAIQQWEMLGKPSQLQLIELGPGKGTLMRDFLNAAKVVPSFYSAIDIHLVETSEKLVKEQQQTLAGHNVSWHASFADIPDGPSILIANEFLDVLPIRQYVKAGDVWHERVLCVGSDDILEWTLGSGILAAEHLPDSALNEPDGSVIEISTAREAFISNIAERIKEQTGAALFIDYGHFKTGFGDTFQAIKAHEYIDPLDSPGEADLTSHVDFDPLIKIVETAGLDVALPLTQGEFLLSLGLLERAGQLGAGKSGEVQKQLTSEAERLALPHEMGDLFKVLQFVNKP